MTKREIIEHVNDESLELCTRTYFLEMLMDSDGNLYLYGTKITKLPENLSVGGNLDLRETKITELPESLSVGGSLDLRETKITELPESLKVKGKILR